jgi:hypothetical protein
MMLRWIKNDQRANILHTPPNTYYPFKLKIAAKQTVKSYDKKYNYFSYKVYKVCIIVESLIFIRLRAV